MAGWTDKDKADCQEVINRLDPQEVYRWLHERMENCERIGSTKAGEDRARWIEDAAYFSFAVVLLVAAYPADTASPSQH